MTTKRYFTLCILDGDKWYPDFGDYELEVVAQELDDRLDSDDSLKRSDTRIVTSTDEQGSIEAAVAALNVRRNGHFHWSPHHFNMLSINRLIDNGEAAIKAIKILSADGPGVHINSVERLRRIYNICRLLEDVAAQPKE